MAWVAVGMVGAAAVSAVAQGQASKDRKNTNALQGGGGGGGGGAQLAGGVASAAGDIAGGVMKKNAANKDASAAKQISDNKYLE